MLTAPQRRILQSENRTALWRYIVKTRANKPRLSSFRVSELYFQRVQALPTFRCCCTLLVQHVSACWRRIVAPFVWYTLYVLQYAFSSLVWAGSSERRNFSSSYFCTSVFESWKTKFVRVVRRDNAKRLTPGLFSFSFPSPDALYHFFWIFRRLRSSLTNAMCAFLKRPRVIGFVLLWSTTVPIVAFRLSKTKV